MQFIVSEILYKCSDTIQYARKGNANKSKSGDLGSKCKIVQGHFRVFAVILLATCCGFGVEL